MNAFWDVAPLIILFPIFYLMLKALLDYNVKKKLIEKGEVNENVKFLAGHEGGYLNSLKWGLVTIGIGLALIIARAFDLNVNSERDGIVVFGAIFFAAGLGLVIHYFIAVFSVQKEKEKK